MTKLQQAWDEVERATIEIDETENGTEFKMTMIHGEEYTVVAFLVTKRERTGTTVPVYKFKKNVK